MLCDVFVDKYRTRLRLQDIMSHEHDDDDETPDGNTNMVSEPSYLLYCLCIILYVANTVNPKCVAFIPHDSPDIVCLIIMD